MTRTEKFIHITVTDKDGERSLVSFRCDSIIAFNKTGLVIGIVCQGAPEPFTITLATEGYAEDLYHKIEQELT